MTAIGPVACALLALVIVVTAMLDAPARRRHAPRPAPPRRVEITDPPPPPGALTRSRTDAHANALIHAYDRMLMRRLLTPIGLPAPDPGNPGATLRLVEDPYGAITEPGGRVLLVKNPPDGPHATTALPVPPHITDPVTAAAWTYSVDRDTYLQLARRT